MAKLKPPPVLWTPLTLGPIMADTINNSWGTGLGPAHIYALPWWC